MTVFSAISSAMIRTVGEKPRAAYSEQRGTAMEMAELANDVARDIIAGHQWSVLLETATLDGTADGVDLPADYDRMPIGGYLDHGNLSMQEYEPVSSLSVWNDLRDDTYPVGGGRWMIHGGKLHVMPAAALSMAYLSRNYAVDDSGALKAEFTADTDSFRLDERLLVLGLVWRWKAQKGLAYAEDMQTYEVALSQAQTRDGGSRIITRGGRRCLPLNVAPPLRW